MGLTSRLAVDDDVDDLTALTAAHRRRLAAWSPTWWRISAVADQVHPFWLKHLIQSEGPIVRVVEDDGVIVGCSASSPQPEQWFVDDVAVVDDARWSDAGLSLLRAVTERPALTCVATADTARAHAAIGAGLQHVSSYWIRPPVQGAAAGQPIPPDMRLPLPAPHTFGGSLDAQAPGALAFVLDGGLVVGSPPVMAPPVYDPGGTICVVDRIVGANRAQLLQYALAGAAARGDVLLNVVTTTDDTELEELVAEADFQRTVEVYAWPAGFFHQGLQRPIGSVLCHTSATVWRNL